MDPNKCLEEIRALCAGKIDPLDCADDFDELRERVRALDEWLSKGGFMPRAWPDKLGAVEAVIDALDKQLGMNARTAKKVIKAVRAVIAERST